MQAQFWTDEPIEAVAQDEFERSNYAQRTAELIRSTHSWRSSTVFGLVGPWGSGKTSLIAMVKECLPASDVAWSIAEFTPWATGDANSMLAEFFASITKSLPANSRDKFKRAVGPISDIAAPLAVAIPIFGPLASTALKTAGKAARARKPWKQAFEQASDQLRDIGVPILVIVEDVDRLQADELLVLLKVIRLLGRFPGVQYLLAYDDESLFRTLERTTVGSDDDGSGQKFMEKIVQYPLAVPPLTDLQIQERLEQGLRDAYVSASREQVRMDRVESALPLFRRLLHTPRTIDRFCAQVSHHLPFMDASEIDDEDLILLTLVKTTFPLIYSQLPLWKEELLTGSNGEFDVSGPSIVAVAAEWNSLLEYAPTRYRPEAAALLTELFPSFAKTGSAASWHPPTGSKRVSVSEYFNRYFLLGISTADVSDQEVVAATVAAASGSPGALRTLLLDDQHSRAMLVADKARNYETQLDLTSRAHLIATLGSIVGEVSDAASGFFSVHGRTISWLAELIAGFPSKTPTLTVQSSLNAIEPPDARISVWRRMQGSLGPTDSPSYPTWAVEITAELVSAAKRQYLENLRSKDAAPTHGHGSALHFALTHGAAGDIRAEVELGLSNNEFDIEDVAARSVSVVSYLGPNARWELGDIDIEELARVLPMSVRNDAWFDLASVHDIDRSDLTWPNRRAYARGRVVGLSAASEG